MGELIFETTNTPSSGNLPPFLGLQPQEVNPNHDSLFLHTCIKDLFIYLKGIVTERED